MVQQRTVRVVWRNVVSAGKPDSMGHMRNSSVQPCTLGKSCMCVSSYNPSSNRVKYATASFVGDALLRTAAPFTIVHQKHWAESEDAPESWQFGMLLLMIP